MADAAPGATHTLLVVGPLPPPLGGASVSVQTLLDALAERGAVRTRTIDTSPAPGRGRLVRALSVLRRTARHLGEGDALLVFGTSRFLLTLGPWLIALARLRRTPIFLRPFAGDLVQHLHRLPGPLRRILRAVLALADGLLPETRGLCSALELDGYSAVHWVPGFRPALSLPPRTASRELRLVMLSQIRRGKGAEHLLAALRALAGENGPEIRCDFYGPVRDPGFDADLRATPGASHRGTVGPAAAAGVIAGYDALVLPTELASEGHPGAILEAMHAGVAVVASRIGAIPELVTHGENGLLVAPGNRPALADALRQLARDRERTRRLGLENLQRGRAFRSDVVVPRLLEIVLGSEQGRALRHPGRYVGTQSAAPTSARE